jgi:hypothetical protein
MTDFKFGVNVNSPAADIVSAALGDGSSEIWSSDDVNKAVKLGADSTYVALADGDEIEGFVTSVEPGTVNSGYSFGSVQRNKRVEAEVGATEAGTISIGDLVVADGAVAVNGTKGLTKVKTGSPTTHKWRVIAIVSGTGATGDKILLERV